MLKCHVTRYSFPPTIHVWSALVDAVLDDQALTDSDPTMKAALQAYMTEKIEKQSQTEAGLEVTACRRRTNCTKEEDQAMCRITWCCKANIEHDVCTHQVDTIMILAMQHLGAVVNLGAPPPGNHERVLGKMLRG